MSGENGDREGSAQERAVQRNIRLSTAGEAGTAPQSASLTPVLVLYQRAWEWTQRTELSLGQFQRAAEAAALADAICYLLAEAGDLEGHERWTVKVSEARQWLAAVHDGLTQSEDVQE
jgi:hypothetical protein